MGDSGDSSSASDCGSPQPKGRSTNKVFVWLKEKAKCTPRGNPWVLLNREGRVKDLAIQGNYSSAKMKELVKENFAGLAAVDLNRRSMHQIKVNADEIHKLKRMIHLTQNLIIREEEGEISLQKAIENDKKKLIKKSSKKIREARQGRVTQPSLEGEKVTIFLCHLNGKEKRQFNKGAFFQEVYDWAGSNECLPLYFTIQRGREVVRHGDLLERTEVLHIYERVSKQ
ncbi:unnamed protein product [Pocillopora meandrina]|uniref:Uncharacterized protein n=1 Tax=Pocillopora meandrina TaxID=46732 RepID=A0AAU9XT28_9CNID|nr:unnamed protein product [Pocillopora meandrina]